MRQTDEQNLQAAEAAADMGDNKTALKYYLLAAEAGIVTAMTACGNLYLDGGEIKQDIQQALEWFKKAAEFGNVTAINNIGYVYELQGNYEESLKWYEKAANLNSVTAMMNLSGMYKHRFKNKKLAQFWLDKAESCTDLESVKTLAAYYWDADRIRNHKEKAIKFYEKAAKMCDVESLEILGELYFEIENFEAAEHYYFRAAKAGNVEAMVNFGILMTYSPDNFENAYFWLKQAIQRKSTIALKIMGDLFREYRQYPQALRWYRKALNAGEFVQNDIKQMKKLIKTYKADCKLKLRLL